MKKPEVENPKLKKLVDELWTKDPKPIGDGSIADAIRHERKTGKPVGGKFHDEKGKGYVQALEKWLRSKSSPKPDSDKQIARAIIKDIRKALKGESYEQ